MTYMLIVAQTSLRTSENDKTRLFPMLRQIAETVRSTTGCEVLAENCFLIDMRSGASVFATTLHNLMATGLQLTTAPLQDRPTLSSQPNE